MSDEMIGARLLAARTRLGLTQTQAAEKAGIFRPNWAHYESGKKVPSLDMLYRIAANLGVKPSSLDPRLTGVMPAPRRTEGRAAP